MQRCHFLQSCRQLLTVFSLLVRDPGSHRREHLHALTEVPDEGHDGHLLHETLDFAELHHEAVLIRQALQRLAFLLKLPQDFNLILCGLEAHQALHKVHRQSS